MNIKALKLILVFNFFLSNGQSFNNWEYPAYPDISHFSNGKDTNYFIDTSIIFQIRSSDTLYEYYHTGNLQSISQIIFLKKETVGYADPKVKNVVMYYQRNGPIKIFFNDSTRKIAVAGHYRKNKLDENRLYYDSLGTIIKKSYPMMLWTRYDYYDSNRTVIKQVDMVDHMGSDLVVRDVEFKDGKEKVILNKTLFAKIYLGFTMEYMIMFFSLMMARIFVNTEIYSSEYGRRVSPFVFFAGPVTSGNQADSIEIMFTFWFSKYKKENKILVYISNTFSMATLLLFFGAIIGLAISGEIPI